jgi:hypothetical protein
VQVQVAIGEELHLEMIERVVHRIDAVDQRRHDDGGAERARNAARGVEIELRQQPGRQERRHEQVHQRDRDVDAGNEREEEHRGHGGGDGGTAEPEHGGEHPGGTEQDAADEDRIGIPVNPPECRLTGGRSVAGGGFEPREADVDEIEADMAAPDVVDAGGQHFPRVIHRATRDRRLVLPRALGDPLHGMPVMVARRKGHLAVEPRRILAQHGVERALVLDERPPVGVRDRTKARDAVRHHELREREPLPRERAGVVGAERFLREPLLEADERRIRAAHRADLLEQSRDECRGQLWRRRHEAGNQVAHGARPILVRFLHQRRPFVRLADVVEPLHRAQRHAAHALERPESQHRRHRPQLADGQRRRLLEGGDEQLDIVQVDAAFGVRDERDRQLVDARVSGERSIGEHRQLAVVAAREALVDLPDVLAHHVEVVQQPFARGTDVAIGRDDFGELLARLIQHHPGLVQARQEGRARTTAACGQHVLALREPGRALTEPVGAERLPPEWSGEQLLGAFRRARIQASEQSRDRWSGDGRPQDSREMTGIE